jgi:vacuolar-type H+-ATPase subunit H
VTTREKAQKLLDETPEEALEPVVEILASRDDNGTEAEASTAQKQARQEAIEFLQTLDSGEDDGYDFTVSERLHASR